MPYDPSQVGLQAIIETAYESRAQLTPRTTPPDLRASIEAVIDGLDRGSLRVCIVCDRASKIWPCAETRLRDETDSPG